VEIADLALDVVTHPSHLGYALINQQVGGAPVAVVRKADAA
jgi:hypothetical protein